jgi:hypothetical protein
MIKINPTKLVMNTKKQMKKFKKTTIQWPSPLNNKNLKRQQYNGPLHLIIVN